MTKDRKDECGLCYRRKYPVYQTASGLYLCGREDCFDAQLDGVLRSLKKTFSRKELACFGIEKK